MYEDEKYKGAYVKVKSGPYIASWESPYSDDLDRFVEGFYGALVTLGYSPAGILDKFEEFANDMKTVKEDIK